jgi:hypothetical protein
MANEIQMAATLVVNRGGLTLTGTGNAFITQAGTPSIGDTQNISTTTEALAIGDITNIGYVFVKNLDPTNYVQLGLNTPVADVDAMITLLPGEFAIFPTRIETIYAKAHTGACDVQVIAASL